MSVGVKLPPPLRAKAMGAEQVRVEGETVGQCLEALIERYPMLRDEILDHRGALLFKWSVYVNDRMAACGGGLSQPVHEGDTILLVPLLDGG